MPRHREGKRKSSTERVVPSPDNKTNFRTSEPEPTQLPTPDLTPANRKRERGQERVHFVEEKSEDDSDDDRAKTAMEWGGERRRSRLHGRGG